MDWTTVATAAEALRVSSSEPGLARLITTASELLATWVGYPLHWRQGVVDTCADGTQVVSSAVLFTDVEVAPEDLVWPPGADSSNVDASRKPLSVAPQVGLLTGRVDHYEVTL